MWRELAVPVIAAITGPCLGGGLQIAMGADIRLVAADAKLSVLEMRWGLIPDMTGTWILPRLVGDAAARELTYTGRMISGEEAVRIGLASRGATTRARRRWRSPPRSRRSRRPPSARPSACWSGRSSPGAPWPSSSSTSGRRWRR